VTWLDRLKNHREPEGDAAKPTKPGTVGFVAPGPDGFQSSPPPAVPQRLRVVPPAIEVDLQPPVGRTCADCLHLLPHGTCGEPVGACLVPDFGIVWPPDGHAARCAAFSGKALAVKQDRPYRLTMEQADQCHTPCWDDAEIDWFGIRHVRFIRLGMADHDADDLAERLTLRDREGDDRHMCLDCRELALSGRCSAVARGAMPGVGRQMEPVPDILMRCPSFKLAVSVHRINQGTEDASRDD